MRLNILNEFINNDIINLRIILYKITRIICMKLYYPTLITRAVDKKVAYGYKLCVLLHKNLMLYDQYFTQHISDRRCDKNN